MKGPRRAKDQFLALALTGIIMATVGAVIGEDVPFGIGLGFLSSAFWLWVWNRPSATGAGLEKS